MGVLDLLEKQTCVRNDEWTHISILNKDKVRYYIARKNNARNNLVKTLNSYSIKHNLFRKLITLAPVSILKKANMINFVKLSLDKRIEDFVNENIMQSDYAYNVIIGTYGKHQKIVLQIFGEWGTGYCKIGNESTSKQMSTEIEFLKCVNSREFSVLVLPTYINSCEIDGVNMLITKEFNGKKVYPDLNDEIYALFKEVILIKSPIVGDDGIIVTFSHGDFAPWNMKKQKGKIILFDWEYCGMRFYGFDLIHFVYQIEKLLKNKDHNTAINNAIVKVKRYDNVLKNIDIKLLKKLYEKEIVKINTK